MKIIILLVLILLSTSVHAETYKWIDKNGTTHFSDYPPPDDQISYEKIKSDRPLQERAQKDSLNSDLTKEDLQFIELLKKRGIIPEKDPLEMLTHGQLMSLKEMLKSEIDLDSIGNPPDPRFSSPEKTFQLYKDSLIKGDLELALNCLTIKHAKRQKETFKALGQEAMKKIGEDMQPIQKIKRDEQVAKYRIRRNQNGQEVTYYIYFANIFGNWKIDQF